MEVASRRWQDPPVVGTGRLSRQELGWLLAQEARGAARVLRQDVTLLTQPPPPESSGPAGAAVDSRVETTLNALDDTISLLADLETGPAASKARRGRIDLAALLYEVAPSARISIEPGAGTEVFGEEVELRRLLQFLVSQSSSPAGTPNAPASEVRIRREGDWVRISVELGPDISAGSEIERRWLSRMTTRQGGRLELEGGTESVILPADASQDRSEVADLRKELAEAQRLGEAYARELADIFTSNERPSTRAPADVPTGPPASVVSAARLELLVGMAGAVHKTLRPMLQGLESAALCVAPAEMARLRECLAVGSGLATDLARLTELPREEAPVLLSIAAVLEQAAETATPRAAQLGVNTRVEADPDLRWSGPAELLRLLVRSLLDQAFAATPRDGSVVLTAALKSRALTLEVRDDGPVVPQRAQRDLLEHRVDPAAYGRPSPIALLVADTLVQRLGGEMSFGEAEGKCLLRVVLPTP